MLSGWYPFPVGLYHLCIIRESNNTPPIRLSSSTISPLPGALLLITNTTSPHHSGYNCGARVLFRPMRTEFTTCYDVRENARGTTNSSSAFGLLHHPLLNYYYYYPSINKQSIEWMSLLLVNLFVFSLSFSFDLWSYYLLVDDIYVHPFISCPLKNVLKQQRCTICFFSAYFTSLHILSQPDRF